MNRSTLQELVTRLKIFTFEPNEYPSINKLFKKLYSGLLEIGLELLASVLSLPVILIKIKLDLLN